MEGLIDEAFLFFTVYVFRLDIYMADSFTILAVFGENIRFENYSLCSTLKERSLPIRILSKTRFKNWRAITLGHGIIYSKLAGEKTKKHEGHHVEQFETAMLSSLFLSVIGVIFGLKLIPFLLIWNLGAAMLYLSATIIAVLKGEDLYRGNVLEKGAYAVGRQMKNK